MVKYWQRGARGGVVCPFSARDVPRPPGWRRATCDNRQNMLHCREVTKRFGEFVALDNISFDLPGGICALLGPNGAGKSTLLKILTGLLAPDRGEVLIAGRDVAKEPLRVK